MSKLMLTVTETNPIYSKIFRNGAYTVTALPPTQVMIKHFFNDLKIMKSYISALLGE